MNIGIGFINLWLIFALVFIFAWMLMAVGNKLRGVKIENPEDHHNPKTALVHAFPLLTFLVISIVTPIVTGSLFWIGSMLLVIAGIIYLLSIAAFVKAQKGLTTIGVYRVSRNPMYIAWVLTFVSFSLMAWQANTLMGIITACITLINAFMIHWMVQGEERFLGKKYGETYNDYLKTTPRYLGILKKIPRSNI